MHKTTYADIVTPELLLGAIENREFHGFLQDYHVLHCLLRKYKPKSFCEIGTNMGVGTKIICNALGPGVPVYSLDLPTELAHISLQHPISEGKGDRVGSKCDLPFTQLRGDSMTFDFSQYPCDGYFVDGEHDFEHVWHEIGEIGKCDPTIIIFHDADIQGVKEAIIDKLVDCGGYFSPGYQVYFVTDTRIAYAVRK